MNIALILSGGSGSRFGNDTPKQYFNIDGRRIIDYSIEALKLSTVVDRVVIVASNEYIHELKQNYNADVIIGGKTRNESLRNGLDYINLKYSACDKVFINEAARPFITSALVDKYVELLDEYDAVITTQHITASLGCVGKHIIDRSEYYLIQAPEAFRFKLLCKHFKADSPITATNQQLPPESKVYKNFEFRNNFKITYPEDLAFTEHLMRCQR